MSCDTSGDRSDVGDEDPRDGAGDRGFEVLGEAATPSEPRKGSFDDPAAR